MKTKVVVFSMAAFLIASVSFAQSVENDDMYFNSKDREKLKAQRATEEIAVQASAKKKKPAKITEDQYASSETYSPRNENPEYAARSNSQQASEDNQDYFVNDYKYNNYSELNKFNNNFNNWYSNPWYSANYFSPSIYGWNSPYYGSAYDSWGNPWMNPYYSSGWSSSFSFHMGSSWNYGWGGSGWGMGMAYGSPYMNYGWGPSYGYGYGGYYPGSIVIINNGEGRNVAYGKRATHGGMVSRQQGVVNSRTRPTAVVTENGTRPSYNSGGRVATTTAVPSSGSKRQEDYYNNRWRNAQQGQSSSPSYSQPSRSSSGWTRPTDNDYSRPNTPSPSYNSGSRSSDGGGGATRSSAPASSGSNGRTRGRD